MTRFRSTVRALLAVGISMSVTSRAVAQSYLGELPLHQKTRYFDFRFKRNPERIKEIGRFADAFIERVKTDFFDATFDYPIQVLVLEDRRSFQNFVQRHFGVREPPNFGIFLYRYNLFCTFEDSGLGTFSHEIMHPLVERNLKDVPVWAIEGIPTFFEKFYGYWEGEKLVVKWGFQNPWRIAGLGTNLTSLDLKSILSSNETPRPYNESDRRLVAMFLWEQGKLTEFFRLLQAKDKHGYSSYFEGAMDTKLKDILPRWQNYLNEVAARRSEILRLPVSTILPDEASFQTFLLGYHIQLPSSEPKRTNPK
jgi:hypothetical protein